ncbi:hypothetical protein BJY04DRAFT_216704 [Aspergillus karnatakaensis]|uniref:uncharacterized protein n=1 Tax=Aspergillus karnatakaensis TaxID=1810916 RepID=UPI003CCE0DA8
MAEVLRQETGSDGIRNSSILEAPTKRRPPKLKRKNTVETRPDHNAQYQFGRGTHEQGFFDNVTSSLPGVPQSKSDSDSPSSGTTNYSTPAAQMLETAKGKQAIVFEREVGSSPDTSRRGSQLTQQLVQVDDVGDAVNGAGELVQDVGTKTVETVGDTAGGVVSSVGNAVGVRGNRSETEQLRLRLDLNLDIEVQLKAKIHGDLTLQLL